MVSMRASESSRVQLEKISDILLREFPELLMMFSPKEVYHWRYEEGSPPEVLELSDRRSH